MRATYGDVIAEQRAMHEAAAVVRGAHELVWVEGPGTAAFLQGILSQDVEAVASGGVARSFLLQPQGKLVAVLALAVGDDRVGIAVDAGLGERVATELNHYRIRVKAEIRLDEREIWELWGPEAPAIVDVGDRWVERDGSTLVPLPGAGVPRILVAGEPTVSGLPPAGAVAVTAVRVEAGEPVMGRDVDEKTIPQETGLVDEAVSFTKGCYLGQELVARIDSRGRVNRHLRGVVITRNVLPPEPSDVVAGDAVVGTLTSISESFAVGAPVGLSLVRREVEPGDEVGVRWDGGETPAIVRELPLI